MDARRGPTRLQKRWSGRLRTGGALLLLLGGVGLVDRLVGLAAPAPTLSPVGRATAPLPAVLALIAAGAVLFALGRRWR